MISILTPDGSKNLILRGVQTASGVKAIEAGSITAPGPADRQFWDGSLASLEVIASPAWAGGGASTAATVTITTAAVIASATGGSPPYTYQWAISTTDGGTPAWQISSPTTAGTTFYVPGVAPGITREAEMQCTITDSRGATGTVLVPAQVQNYWV